MKKNSLIISFLVIVAIIFTVLYINANQNMRFIEKRDNLRLLNYEADNYSYRIAVAFCNEKDMSTILNEGIDIEQPLSFSKSKAIKNIQQMKYISDEQVPVASYVIDYQVFESIQGENLFEPYIIRQTVLIKKSDDRNGSWTFEILNYEDPRD